MDLVDKLSIAGSPEECIEKIENLEAHGLNHLFMLITDAELLKQVTHKKTPDIPNYREIIKLVKSEIMPHFINEKLE